MYRYTISRSVSPLAPSFVRADAFITHNPTVYDGVFASHSYSAPKDFGMCSSPGATPRRRYDSFTMDDIEHSSLPSASPCPFLQPQTVIQGGDESIPLQMKGECSSMHLEPVTAHLLPPPLEDLGKSHCNLNSLLGFQQQDLIGRIPVEWTDDFVPVNAYFDASSDSVQHLMVPNAYAYSQTSSSPSSPCSPHSNDDTDYVGSSSSESSRSSSPSVAACMPVQLPPSTMPLLQSTPPDSPPSRRTTRSANNASVPPTPKSKLRGEKRRVLDTAPDFFTPDPSEVKKVKSNLLTLELSKKDRLQFTTHNMTPAKLSGKLVGLTELNNGSFLFAVERVSNEVDGGEKKEIVFMLTLRFRNGETTTIPVHLRLRAFKSGGKCTNNMVVHETHFAHEASLYTLSFVFECRNSYKRGTSAANYIGNNDAEGLWFRYQSQTEVGPTDADGISLHAPKYVFKMYAQEQSLGVQNPIVGVDTCTASVMMWSKESQARYGEAEDFTARLLPFVGQAHTVLEIRDVKPRKD